MKLYLSIVALASLALSTQTPAEMELTLKTPGGGEFSKKQAIVSCSKPKEIDGKKSHEFSVDGAANRSSTEQRCRDQVQRLDAAVRACMSATRPASDLCFRKALSLIASGKPIPGVDDVGLPPDFDGGFKKIDNLDKDSEAAFKDFGDDGDYDSVKSFECLSSSACDISGAGSKDVAVSGGVLKQGDVDVISRGGDEGSKARVDGR